MSNFGAFTPFGNTVCLSVVTTSHTPVQVAGTGSSAVNYRIYNAGTNTAFILASMPQTGNVAPSMTVTIPTDGTPGNGIPVVAGATVTLNLPPNAYFSAICANAQSATIYITPGDGI
jgi:hypothetical protein